MPPDRLADLTAQLLDAARKSGADAADALAVAGSAISVDVRMGALEGAKRSDASEIGLRVFIGRRQASVAASDLSPATIVEMAERAVAMAREAPEDPTAGLADPDQLARGWDTAALELADPGPEPGPAELESDARRAEAAMLAVPGVTLSEKAAASWSRTTVHFAATNGFSGGYARTHRAHAAIAISGAGLKMERDWAAESRTYAADLPTPEQTGTLAGTRAAALQGARKPATGAFPVLFDERVAGSLIGHLLAAINGAAIARGASWARALLHQPVLPATLSLLENPHRPRISGSRPFDAEGLPTKPRSLVADGLLQGWILDLATARKLGLTSTASATRGTSGPPSPAPSNIALTQGSASREALIAEMGTGLLVTSFLGASINPTTGDYSRGASGFWVERGAIAYPVNECTIAGSLPEMLARITPANDARPHFSHVVPSLLVEGLTLAGG